ncbi:hypothetical protein [Rheinheimera sp.]|uniref:hypothetical protein n=1 Tax=Rheinheimera sp. TaxID=1869214 RepID=UPI0027BAA4C2|nr:hypothetical protein [Rheinheimera sp.]
MKKSPIATKHDQGLGRRATFIAVAAPGRWAVAVSSVVEEIRLAENQQAKNKTKASVCRLHNRDTTLLC